MHHAHLHAVAARLERTLGPARIGLYLRGGFEFTSAAPPTAPARFIFSRTITRNGVPFGSLSVEIPQPRLPFAALQDVLDNFTDQLAALAPGSHA